LVNGDSHATKPSTRRIMDVIAFARVLLSPT
jgi:hypothetical protein